jgi:predicted permease
MFLESFRQDLWIGVRVLVKEKGFCALAVASVAIGIGAVSTEFAVVDGALLRGFSFPQAERLVDVRLIDPASIYPKPSDYVTTMADFVDLKAQQTSFAGFVAYMSGHTINVTCQTRAESLVGSYVSHDFFSLLGVAPVLGRDFRSEDDRPGASRVVILGDALWRSDFGGDPGVIGRSVRINGGTGTIIGVMAPGFAFPRNEQLWMPINSEFPPQPRGDKVAPETRIIARLKAGVSVEQADAEVATIARRLAAQFPENKASGVGGVFPLARALVGPWLVHLAWSMLAGAGGVLLIACLNVMNMQSARAMLRVKEIAIRSSLGATRTRLVRQMLTECLLLASIGAVLGIALAAWATGWLDAEFHSFRYPLPSWMTFRVDARVVALAVGLAAIATVIAGLLPALAASRPNLVSLLKDASRGSPGRWAKAGTRALVIVQIAVSCVLLIGALIEAQSNYRGQNVAYGYDTGSVLAGCVNLMKEEYPTNDSRIHFYEKLLRQLRATAGIKCAALTSRFQMVFAGFGERIEIDGRSYHDDLDRPVAQLEKVSDGYWAITRQRLLAGRDFTLDDTDVRQPVAIVNETFARKFFGQDNPIGHRFRMVRNGGKLADSWRTIIGVVTEVRMLVPANVHNDNAGFYLPFNASLFANGPPAVEGPPFATIVLRLRGEQRPDSFADSLRREVARVDPDLPVYFIGTPEANLAVAFGIDRTISRMVTLLSVVALLLTAVGIYGTVSFSVNRRMQEFGIRMALGADRGNLVGLVLKEGAGQLALGLGFGLAATVVLSFAAEEWITTFALFQIGPRDPATYAAVALMFAVVAAAATIGPARRAARADPMAALRAE